MSSQGKVKIEANINPHIIPGDSKLGNTILVVSAPILEENIHIVTPCEHQESILYKKPTKEDNMLYVIQITFPVFCETSEIRIGDLENIFTDTFFSLPMESFLKVENNILNTDSAHLLSTTKEQTVPMSARVGSTMAEKLKYLRRLYKNLDASLQGNIAKDILHDRENTKYLSPVLGYGLPTKDILIPGANRGYRRDTTDGVHHGWDIMAPMGTPVQALSKGKIIRIKNDWSWDDFNALKRENLTRDDEFLNLDIFRGNQVWLQTMDGNVTFYSHLSKISDDIVLGASVDKGTYLGNIGRSGVPDKNYKNLHLHFEIQQNPFREDGKNPNYLDIMRWDYAGEHMKKGEVHEKMREIFE